MGLGCGNGEEKKWRKIEKKEKINRYIRNE